MSSTPPLAVTSTWATVAKTGRWEVPARIVATSTMGAVLLDFTAADCPHEQVEVEVNCQAGGITLIVPDGWAVDTSALNAQGAGVSVTVGGTPRPELPRLRVTGRVTWGRLVITDDSNHASVDHHAERQQRHAERRAERARRHSH